jgi:Protein of unknown function (DUF2809)
MRGDDSRGPRHGVVNSASNHDDRQARRSRLVARAGLCLSIMVAGLALRGFGFRLGLPAFLVKYGGSLLWAAMVYFLVAMVASRLKPPRIALMAAAIAVGVELLRLVHTPWLDAFRLTMAGALLLGRIFSPWNMLAYGVGIVLAMGLDHAMSAFTRARDASHSAS